MKISIPKPCHENWDLMTPTEKGRFCEVCSKVVRDFSQSTNDDIIDFFYNTDQEICGKFKSSQLNNSLFPSILKKSFLTLLLPFAALGINAQNNTRENHKTIVEYKSIIQKHVNNNSIHKDHSKDYLGVVKVSEIEDEMPLIVINNIISSPKIFLDLDEKKIKEFHYLNVNNVLIIVTNDFKEKKKSKKNNNK